MKSRRQGVRAMDEGQRLIVWRRWIFRLTRPYVLMPAREAFIIDRAKSSCGVGVVQMLNSHWPGTSPAEHVRECYPPKIVSQFHPPPSSPCEGSLIGPPTTKSGYIRA